MNKDIFNEEKWNKDLLINKVWNVHHDMYFLFHLTLSITNTKSELAGMGPTPLLP